MKRRLLIPILSLMLCFGMTGIVSADTSDGIVPEMEDQQIQNADDIPAEDQEEVDPVEDTDPADAEDETPAVDPNLGDEDGELPDVIPEDGEEPQEDITETPQQATLSGWNLDSEGNWRYYQSDTPVKGLQKIDGSTYFFDNGGYLMTGIQNVNEVTYYFSEKGANPTNGLGTLVNSAWVNSDDGNVYYINSSGSPVSEWQTINNKIYYFDKDSYALATGFTTVGNNTFYFEPKGAADGTLGAAKLGWQKIDNAYYYFKQTGDHGVKGTMAKGWKNIKNKTYYFSKVTGKMATGWKNISKKIFYFKGSGDPGERGRLFTGWYTTKAGKTYYFKPTGKGGEKGQLYTGWKYINKKAYCFKASGGYGDRGTMYTGWRKISEKIFYFQPTGGKGVKGQRKSGWQKIGGKKFYFQPSGGLGKTGAMYTGLRKVGNNVYCFKTNGGYGTRGAMLTGWQKINGSWYYMNSNGTRKTGWLRSGGYWYYLNKSNGKMATGWTYVPVSKATYSSYKFYFRPKKSGSAPAGSLVQDVSSLIGRQGSYYTEINRVKNTVVIYAKDETGKYRIPVKTMTCSVGLPATPTPTGTFHTLAKYRWKELMGPSWGQYATRIVGGVLFHSVAGSNATSYNLSAGNYNMLGQAASHGCVRLCVRDAKWIYDNCPLGMTVKINDSAYQPFDKPATIKIPAGQTWDPTDPNV